MQAKVGAPPDASSKPADGAAEAEPPTGNHTQGDPLLEAAKGSSGSKAEVEAVKGLPTLGSRSKKKQAQEKAADKAEEATAA